MQHPPSFRPSEAVLPRQGRLIQPSLFFTKNKGFGMLMRPHSTGAAVSSFSSWAHVPISLPAVPGCVVRTGVCGDAGSEGKVARCSGR